MNTMANFGMNALYDKQDAIELAKYGLKTQDEELPKKTMAVLNILNTMPRL